MADRFIPLTCKNCGGKLEIYDDMDRFACGYCGTELAVERRGGTVSLKAISEAIQKVQAGTDKTAAELAIVRYENELKDLRTQRDAVIRSGSGAGCFGGGCGGIFFVIGVFAALAGNTAGWSGILVGALVLAALKYQSSRNVNAARDIDERIKTLLILVAEKRRIADS